MFETKKETIEKFRNKNKNKKFIWAYKVYESGLGKGYGKTLYSPFYNTPYIGPGIIQSNRSRITVSTKEGDYNCKAFWNIRKGIHVYLSKENAQEAIKDKDHCVVVKVKCPMSEFVAKNYYKNEAVFRSIYLSEKEYNEAIKNKRINKQKCHNLE